VVETHVHNNTTAIYHLFAYLHYATLGVAFLHIITSTLHTSSSRHGDPHATCMQVTPITCGHFKIIFSGVQWVTHGWGSQALQHHSQLVLLASKGSKQESPEGGSSGGTVFGKHIFFIIGSHIRGALVAVAVDNLRFPESTVK